MLELFDARSRLGDHDVAVLELLDELVRAALCLGGARAVALELVQHLGELLAALVLEVVDDVRGVADDVGLETAAQLAHCLYIGRSGRALRASVVRRRG